LRKTAGFYLLQGDPGSGKTTAELLEIHGHNVRVCGDLWETGVELARGAGAMLLTEESLDREQIAALLPRLDRQPAWRGSTGSSRSRFRTTASAYPAAQLDTLFTMFSQVPSAMGRSEGGLGVGLALLKGIAELHGVRVEARSEGPGRGSRFVIALPFEARLESEPTFEEVIGAPQSGRFRVLIVDDNRDAADSLSVLLSMDGHDVRTVYGGRAAVSAAETFRPDVALLDIGMPEVDGYAAARAIRALRGSVDTHLVAITGWGQQEDKRRALEPGFATHLTKPVDPKRLRSFLRSVARSARAGAGSE
jgi:CheY-like chemotaxis protein